MKNEVTVIVIRKVMKMAMRGRTKYAISPGSPSPRPSTQIREDRDCAIVSLFTILQKELQLLNVTTAALIGEPMDVVPASYGHYTNGEACLFTGEMFVPNDTGSLTKGSHGKPPYPP